jgi:transposase-like protein
MPTTVTLHLPEQDHRPIKRIIRPMMGFKDFRCARIILSGDRNRAHDPQRADAERRRHKHRSGAILFAGHVSIPTHS